VNEVKRGEVMATRTVTLTDYLLEALNRRARERGEDVQIVFERPKPWVVARNDGEVVNLQEHRDAR
jgi:hypothetical protein